MLSHPAHVHALDEAGSAEVIQSLQQAFDLADEKPVLKPVICEFY